MDVRLSSEARRPSGSEATVLFSTLNSSSSTQLARDLGIEPVDNRLYLGGKHTIIFLLQYLNRRIRMPMLRSMSTDKI
jgi:hypothetical protein